ncbi:substrate-binding domain-containing protein [Saliterribacillus persicus]|uniref:Monosaccharide ABC transporter substrate-binding protein (CUT2 family) n=1 Tax=Saliterribacillus persicus TaxID=930114 RepID=A0A368XYN5_9BACI|nr:substrate-binding domain-containing protein [Saliterribacillus persicus]RCW73200.1 monosaccharide ABC transporter substrate-binding protein (CUT2 family) [Saliterribacillus persicus]
MRKLLFIYLILIGLFVIYVYNYQTESETTREWSENELRGSMDETYVMVTFQVGIDYWKRAVKGFEDAAEALNVSVEYRGATQYDVEEEITVLEQVIAKNPAGIAVSTMDPTALNDVIDKAVEAGIPVVMFDADAPESKAYSFLGTDNYYAGVQAAHKMADFLNETGEVGVITQPRQLNHQERTQGFQDTIFMEYPDMKVVAIKDGRGDQLLSRQAADEIMREYPDIAGIFATEANGGVGVGQATINKNLEDEIKIISFDTDKGTLDMIERGVISATLAQGTWEMGYWSLQHLFHLNHDIVEQEDGSNPLPRYVDTGISIVTEDNVESYYPK